MGLPLSRILITGTSGLIGTVASRALVDRVVHLAGASRSTQSARSATPPRPSTLYGASKVWGEALGRYYADVHRLSVICLRFGSVNEEDRPVARRRPKYATEDHRDKEERA